MENKSKNRILAACMPPISMPAEWGTLECSDATEDPVRPSSGWFEVVVAGGQWVEAGSPLMQVAALASVHLPGQTAHLHLLFLLCALEPDLHLPPPPRTPCARPTPSSPAAGWAEWQNHSRGLWLEGWQNLLAPSRPQQGLKSCCYEKQSMTCEGKRKKEERKQEGIRKYKTSKRRQFRSKGL